MTGFTHDLRFAFRTLRKAPVFVAVAVLSLALGIGANTAIFTLTDQLILRLLPVRDPQAIVLVASRGRHYGGNNGRNALAYPLYQDFRDRNQVFSAIMCRYSMNFTLGVTSQTEIAAGEFVSGNYFPMLGVQPAAGRLFTSNDDLRAGAHPYAVLSYAYWQSRFGGSPAVIGQLVRANNIPLTIVGVAGRGFDGMEPGIPARIFVPVTMAPVVRPAFNNMYDRRQRWVNVYGRLKPGMTIQQAKAGLQPLFRQIIGMEVTQAPFRNATPYTKREFLRMNVEVLPGSQGNTFLRRQLETPLWVLMAVVGLVLLIACANLASLLTARAASRQKEIAIRLAIGSSRSRIVRQLLTETLLLAIAGSAAGLGLAILMVKGMLRFLPDTVAGYSISAVPDLRILGFTLALALLTGFGFGLIPALQCTRTGIAPILKDQAGSVMGGGGQTRLRKALVAAQVGLSLLLLIGANLFVRSLGNLHLVDPGFHTGNLVQFSVSPRSLGYDSARTAAYYQRLEEQLLASPGISGVGLAQMPLLAGNEWDSSITIEGYAAKAGEDVGPHFNAVSSGFFDALGVRVLQGRGFTRRDDIGAPKVALVNQSFAKRYFGNSSPLGRRFGVGADPGTKVDTEIVGVVNDTRYESLRDEIPREIYLCSSQQPLFSMSVYVRTSHDPEAEFAVIRSVARSIDPSLPLINMKTLARQMDESLVTDRLIAVLSGGFSALATMLALIGLYGVMAYMVTRRAREIGIRMALGAVKGHVVWLVMREVLVLVGFGVAVGLPAALALSRFVSSQLYGVEPRDPAAIAVAAALLCATALAAGYIPARRAASFDPARVLRWD